MKKKSLKKESGFTLIELLIVIGLLGGLTVLILPRLAADREEALADICDYNNAGSTRVLKQYFQLFGGYPADLHTGLQGATGTPDAMNGLPGAQEDHMVTNIATTRLALSAGQAASLSAAGITSIAFDTGLNTTAVVADVVVAQAVSATGTNAWLDDAGDEMQFDGILISDWATATGTPAWDTSPGPVVCLYITPTTNWAAGNGGNQDWTKGAIEYGVDMVGSCPIPTEAAGGGEVAFAYYMAYFKVYNDGTPARLIGSTCPECGVLNP